MALFITETVTTMADFMTKLGSFLTTGGAGNPAWTGELITGATNGVNTTTGEAAFSKAALGTNTNDIQVAFQWDTTSVNHLGIYQYDHASGANNYDNARAGPWDQDNDSGNGFAGTADASLDNERSCPIGNTPIRYWAFTSDSNAEYVYVVVEISTGEFRSFGFGEIEKFNDWNGGAFAFGWRRPTTGASATAVNVGSYHLLDGYFQVSGLQAHMATVQADGLPNQVAGGMWATVSSVEQFYLYAIGTDRQSNGGGTDTARAVFQGGFRYGLGAQMYGTQIASSISGFVPGYPILLMYLDTVPSADDWYGPMGRMDGVLGVNIGQFDPGEIVTIGGVDWTMFPSKKKGTGTDADGTGNQGMMFRHNT